MIRTFLIIIGFGKHDDPCVVDGAMGLPPVFSVRCWAFTPPLVPAWASLAQHTLWAIAPLLVCSRACGSPQNFSQLGFG